MVTVEFLRRVMAMGEQQVCTANGYDGVIAILGKLRGIEFPCLVLEDKDSGYFQVVEGALDVYEQSVWIMARVGQETNMDENSEAFDNTFILMKSLIKKLIKYRDELPGLDTSRMSYYKRLGGPNCCGYQLNISFNEDIDLYE